MLCKVLKGMKDVLPAESARWRALEREMRKAALLNALFWKAACTRRRFL